jgi:outer membrane scaffolding protein for murein synthesis (MipA/OmpV family)
MRSRMLKFLAALGLALGLASTAAAQNYEGWLLGATSMRNQSDSEWKVNLGAGLGFGPGFIGGSQGKAHFLPIVDIEWRKSIFASTQRGIGMNLFGNRQTVAGPRLTFDWGRSPTDDTALVNTAKVKASVEAGGFIIHYTGPWRFEADLKKGLGSGHKGLRANFGGALGGRLSEDTTLIVGGGLHYTGTNYNVAYFGQKGKGFTGASAYADIIREIGDGGYAGLNIRFDRLLGQARDASFTKENQYYAGIYTGVRF